MNQYSMIWKTRYIDVHTLPPPIPPAAALVSTGGYIVPAGRHIDRHYNVLGGDKSMIVPKRFYPHRPGTLGEMLREAVRWFIKTQHQFPECLVVNKSQGDEALELLPALNRDLALKFGNKLRPVELRVNGGTLGNEVWLVVGDEVGGFKEAA